ncbi:Orotidine 5'-phosphate decarboxylase [Peptoniphilus sp. ING2-D1G]|nr:Orotidine 5'-phosphate decarboxylase [Peptoniphilus sp. ING2-D1G]
MNKETIIALDFDSRDKTLEFLDKFQEKLFVKIGMELFYREGPGIIREIKSRNHRIFLDLKLHDIPNTVKKATISLLNLDVDMINYHVAGGREMLRTAQNSVSEKEGLITLGVTMLTSTSEDNMHDDILIDINYSLKETVMSYAKLAKECGLNGVVCSALEVPSIKEFLGGDFLCVTPGIRPKTYGKDDQKRVVTPGKAKELGADFIVVGRPITQSKDPVKTYNEINREFLGE